MVSLADAEEYRQAQVGIRVLVNRDLTRFWAGLDQARPDQVVAAVEAYTPLLVQRYGSAAADLAAEWYDEQRAIAGVRDVFRAVTVASPYEGAVPGMVGRAAGRLGVGDVGGALLVLRTNVGKYALAAGRETIARNVDRDPSAAGWQRVARAGACEFCRLLVGRGAVYRQSTVHFASHGSCNCAAIPSWDSSAPEVDTRLYEASKRTTSMTPEQRDRHNALIRQAID